MEKYISVTYSITKLEYLKVAQLAVEKSEKLNTPVSASSIIRGQIKKLKDPKKKIKI